MTKVIYCTFLKQYHLFTHIAEKDIIALILFLSLIENVIQSRNDEDNKTAEEQIHCFISRQCPYSEIFLHTTINQHEILCEQQQE